jgi:hypothetical protein
LATGPQRLVEPAEGCHRPLGRRHLSIRRAVAKGSQSGVAYRPTNNTLLAPTSVAVASKTRGRTGGRCGNRFARDRHWAGVIDPMCPRPGADRHGRDPCVYEAETRPKSHFYFPGLLNGPLHHHLLKIMDMKSFGGRMIEVIIRNLRREFSSMMEGLACDAALNCGEYTKIHEILHFSWNFCAI